MLRRFSALPLSFSLLLLSVVCAAAQSMLPDGQTNTAPAAPCGQTLYVSSAQSAPELICEVSCDKVKPRTPFAVLIWKVAETPVDAQALTARLATQGLEVTVYKDGFDKQKFAALPSLRREGRFLVRQSSAASQRRTTGLDQLVVVDITPLSEPSDPARFDPSRRRAGRFSYVAVRVEGLEPGLNYFWRVSSETGDRQAAGAIVRCQAPVCPADFRSDVRPR